MKKKKIIFIFYFVFFTICCFLVKENIVSAVDYDYKSGNKEVVYKETTVNSFSYDYIINNSEIISDNGSNISSNSFYSGMSIEIVVDHYSHWWPFTDDDDSTNIYKYDQSVDDFSILEATFINKSGTYLLDKEGLYEVEYSFEDKIIFVNYINIQYDILYSDIAPINDSEEDSVFSSFSFVLKLKDGYNLKNNRYYYAFGTDVNNLNFREFTFFSNEEKNSANQINVIEREIKIKIGDDDCTLVGEKKFFYVKIVRLKGNDKIIGTSKDYEISNEIQANIYLADDYNNIISERMSYKKNDYINIKISFNSLVSYKNLQYSVDGENYIDIDNASEMVREINIRHFVDENVSNFEGNIGLRTKNNIDVVVSYEEEGIEETVAIKVVSLADFDIDVAIPKITLDEGNNNGAKDYSIRVAIDEANLENVKYYIGECIVSDDNICLDEFNEENADIRDLNNDSIITIDESIGKFDGTNLAIFIKAVDKAGNVATIAKLGYVVDNMIVTEKNSNGLFEIEDLENGKKLIVKAPEEYEVTKITYKLESGLPQNCVKNEDEDTFDCFSVENYDFNSNIEIALVDKYGNHEIYTTKFKYSLTIPGTIEEEGKMFTIYEDKEYEIEYINKYNSLAEYIVFNENILNRFANELHFSNLGLVEITKTLIYIDEDDEVTLLDSIINTLSFPTIEEIIEKIGKTEVYDKCSFEKCNFDVYLKYQYKINNIPQVRLVRISYIDNTNKYMIDNFSKKVIVKVDSEYSAFEYSYLDSKGEILANVSKTRAIVFESRNNEVVEVVQIDTSKLGKYIISESFDNSFPLNYVVEVIDDIAPVIKIRGREKLTLSVGEKFVDPFVRCFDNYDEVVTILSDVEKMLDINKPGQYVISYWAVDSSGNISNVVTRTVIVEKENIFLIGLQIFIVLSIVSSYITIAVLIEYKKHIKLKNKYN